MKVVHEKWMSALKLRMGEQKGKGNVYYVGDSQHECVTNEENHLSMSVVFKKFILIFVPFSLRPESSELYKMFRYFTHHILGLRPSIRVGSMCRSAKNRPARKFDPFVYSQTIKRQTKKVDGTADRVTLLLQFNLLSPIRRPHSTLGHVPIPCQCGQLISNVQPRPHHKRQRTYSAAAAHHGALCCCGIVQKQCAVRGSGLSNNSFRSWKAYHANRQLLFLRI